MANPLHHAVSSSRRYGGSPEDFRHVHEWFDEPKGWMPDFRQRAMRHHAEGIAESVRVFDDITLPGGKVIPVRWVSEQHVMEDMGRIPTVADWLRCIQPASWMTERARPLSREQQA